MPATPRASSADGVTTSLFTAMGAVIMVPLSRFLLVRAAGDTDTKGHTPILPSNIWHLE
ncbi:hypothetical protein H310_01477 [Aphanomyces invadans]|uniref:Uncharacterized protein n=1 Tax=Aphanomyces invadans TaxID=157072 RepID=A0A024URE3_9STRA|nr:hypothetical protein H310_01477 [Aphanomyces invadans]ETW09006.1 hypothetical protein H310_01477 [Aphanomyces invadans]|eukprot:XP_008862811.1 hypothetical protein H310_01477 [Aphanomyces invadans]